MATGFFCGTPPLELAHRIPLFFQNVNFHYYTQFRRHFGILQTKSVLGLVRCLSRGTCHTSLTT